ncbi:uncharacterized protein K441DRAFT_655985 [Cenococcum geophilum 1.58]|uniref:uncharacterized protein n=1 Tax=Cenococcum geophilum 1.58 TaxID=794803 RepID=UPI0035901F1A|nr:hypothetical protein K441DRAFT_655985 [Cenococcum geophilum 1.58]
MSVDDQRQQDINNECISKLKKSIIFDNDWYFALAVIPSCLSQLATSNMYGALPGAASADVSQEIDKNLFKSHTVAGCLVEVVNECENAFDLAINNFQDLNEGADNVFEILSKALFPALADVTAQPSEHHVVLLKDAMNDLKKTTKHSHDAVEEVAKAFDQVHAKVGELLRVTNEKVGLAKQAEKLAVLRVYTTSLQVRQTTAAVKTSQDAVGNMKGVLKTAQDSYDRASKNYPSTMEVLGASVAMAFTDCVTSAISQIVPAYVNNMNMVNKIETGIDVLTKDSLDIAKNIEGTVKPVANDKDPAKTVDYASDPAYALAFTDNQYITHIGNIITAGKDNGVDWKSVQASNKDSRTSDKPAVSDLQYLVDQLQESLNRTVLTSKPPSIELKSIASDTVRVANDVLNASKQSDALPAAGSDIVHGWQRSIKDLVGRISTLTTQGNSLPGTGGATGAAFPKPTTSAAGIANKTEAHAQSLLQGAANYLNTTQQALSTSLTAYSEGTKRLAAMQESLGKLKAEVEEYKAEAKVLTEVVVILTLMATSAIDINTKINSLLIHFRAIDTLIGHIVEDQSETLLRKIQLELNEVDRQTKKGPMSNASGLASHSFYVTGCIVAAYFDVLGDSAKNFGEVSKTFITADGDLGGLKMVREAGKPFPMEADKDPEEKPKPTGDTNNTPATDTNSSTGTIDSEQALMSEYSKGIQTEIAARRATIAKYLQNANTKLNAYLKEKTDEKETKMNEHLAEINAQIKEIPEQRVNTDVTKGAKKGAAFVKEAITKAIDTTTTLTALPNVGRSDKLEVKRGL